MRISNAQNMAELDFGETFFLVENAGNRRFSDFVRIFSLYFVVLSHKNNINNNAHHQACFNCQETNF